MIKKHIITIAGYPGSGKSTTAKALSQKLGYNHFSSGDLFRKLSKERGVDVLQTNLSAEENSEVDYLVDEKLREIGARQDKLVIDSRTAWHWIPASFKVFLNLDFFDGAKRIQNSPAKEKRIAENIPDSPKEYAQILKERLESENRRYAHLYNINPNDMKNYDLVIDTGKNDPEEVVRQILTAYKSWLE